MNRIEIIMKIDDLPPERILVDSRILNQDSVDIACDKLRELLTRSIRIAAFLKETTSK